MTLIDVTAGLTTILIVLGIFMLIVTILFWVAIDYLRQAVDALNTANLRGSERRQWTREKHT